MVHTTPIERTLVSFGRRCLIGIIKGYRFFLSPWVGQHCRFTPTCSQYAIEAITEYGCWKGTAKAFMRLCRCHPWCNGGYDPLK